MRKHLQITDRENAKHHALPKYSRKVKSFDGKNSAIFFERRKLYSLYGIPIFPVPEFFDLSSNGYNDELKDFFDELDTLLSTHKRIYLSFKMTKVVRLPMFLLIVALQEKHDAKIYPMYSSVSSWVNSLIDAAGAFSTAETRRKSMADRNVRRIPIISGSNQEFSTLADDLVEAISHKYYNGNIPALIEAKISQAILETLENVGRHAYPHERNDGNKKWWLVCSIGRVHTESEEYMFLAIYDQGRGIPLSFEDSKVFQNRIKKYYPEEYRTLILGEEAEANKRNIVKGFVRSLASSVISLRKTIGDSGMIYASMMHEITRIDDENHGQGSVSIKDVITTDPESKLLIHSCKGCYQFNRGHEKEDTKFEHKNELPGTLLQWSIKLDELN
ncbi:hypothetical protein GWZ53_17140 [Vibrio cholerae]|uniref:hypothetical protein n=1 Tax=Vibrio cholerae TaxID=666 RepID=UPI001560A4B9|nr:hypothetical protein [Vibrio cholerae]NOF82408.1 hypothetical protein [Vibrio cholerae]